MNDDKTARWSFRCGIIGLLCPLGLVLVMLLLRTDVIRFHDDFTGMKGLSFFLLWAFALLPSGLLASSVAIQLKRHSRLAFFALGCNLLPLAWLLVNLV